ncbi:hypothetical protein A0H81_11592 [Grifola frondosa]|uniref:Uncharacterized protein n=1 Tax=Grifola frondosa TaxID=5627 RepID=A0A1C7LWR9_GRIFR|nr:hypothetical protein A0H81_11592 [Grifola frondosa]
MDLLPTERQLQSTGERKPVETSFANFDPVVSYLLETNSYPSTSNIIAFKSGLLINAEILTVAGPLLRTVCDTSNKLSSEIENHNFYLYD